MRRLVYALAFLMLFVSQTGIADAFFKYGIGILKSAVSDPAETKVFTLGYQNPLGRYFVWQAEGGFYSDSAGNGRKNSGFFNLSAGVDVRTGILQGQALWGPGLLTTPDAYIGGHFIFNQDLYLGLRDQRGNGIGLNYKHMSTSGLEMPNYGRDSLLIRMSIPLGE